MANLNPEVRIFPDLESLSEAAAVLFIESSARAIMERGRFLAAFSGGSTPLKLYELLAQSPYREQVDWPRLHVFWGDERCVPPEDLENSYRQAHDVLLGHVPIPAENIHRVNTDLTPGAAAKNYARALSLFAQPPLDWPRFDLVLLGMGEDGHTASLFPGSPIEVTEPTLAVSAQYQGRPVSRVTMTPLVFNSARMVIFMVTGENKAATLTRVLSDDYQPEQLPAQRIDPKDGALIWLADEDAAGKLPRKIKGLKICEG